MGETIALGSGKGMGMNLLFRWLVTALVIFMIPSLVPGVHVAGFGTALAAALVLSVLNFTVRPLLIILTLPMTILTLGFFLFVINALMFQLSGHLVDGFQVDSFFSALVASLITTLVSWILQLSVRQHGGKNVVIVRGWSKKDDVIDIQPSQRK